ncbi:MAG: FAD binding domain-containing protein [Ignavibacteriales bacterium]|nr:FAD binding domain-containing protein [Ignavibacteriales bacterium]
MEKEQTIQCIINDRTVSTDANPNMVVLDFLRGDQRLMGTKEGCREGDCGACTILVGELNNGVMDYKSVNSCLMPLGDADGKHLITIEGTNLHDQLNPIQQAFVDEGGTQCGFCTPGFLMSFTGYCMNAQSPSVENAVRSLDGNICRCTGHPPIKKAAAKIIERITAHPSTNGKSNLQRLVEQKVLPPYVSTIPEQLKALHRSDGTLADVKEQTHIVSGGTDLYVQRAFTMVREGGKRISQQKKQPVIWEEGNAIHCSGMTTVEEFQRSDLIRSLIPKIEVFAALFGSTPIRNRATLAGNIVNASPIGDMTSLLLALDASLVLRDGTQSRTISLRNFYKGYKQIDKTKNEIVETIILPKPKHPRLINFEKVSRRRYLDIASVNSAMVISLDGNKIMYAHVTAGGVFATPLYLARTSEYLTGKEISSDTISQAVSFIQQEIKPISDARGSSDYKRLLARQVFLAHILTFFPDLSLSKELM